jgi:capsular polysaccharide biosynthesis protein
MTETLSRLWGWDQAKQEEPGIKALVMAPKSPGRGTGLQRALFSAYGIDPRDLVVIDRPVWLECVVGATPMWHNWEPFYAHPGILEVWDRIRAGMLAQPYDGPTPQRIFVSRSEQHTRRACRNAHEVELYFRERGFEVVYPERLPLHAQAHVFANAESVAGFAGSAMFNLMYARPREIVILTHEAYTARNEHLYASILGGDLHYFWSSPERSHPDGRWSRKAFDSDWTFDFHRDGDELDAVLTT